jgi:hypothetical protein
MTETSSMRFASLCAGALGGVSPASIVVLPTSLAAEPRAPPWRSSVAAPGRLPSTAHFVSVEMADGPRRATPCWHRRNRARASPQRSAATTNRTIARSPSSVMCCSAAAAAEHCNSQHP